MMTSFVVIYPYEVGSQREADGRVHYCKDEGWSTCAQSTQHISVAGRSVTPLKEVD